MRKKVIAIKDDQYVHNIRYFTTFSPDQCPLWDIDVLRARKFNLLEEESSALNYTKKILDDLGMQYKVKILEYNVLDQEN